MFANRKFTFWQSTGTVIKCLTTELEEIRFFLSIKMSVWNLFGSNSFFVEASESWYEFQNGSRPDILPVILF